MSSRPQTQAKTLMSLALLRQCRALASVPHEFRAITSWLNYDCAVLPQFEMGEERDGIVADMDLARAELDAVMRYFDPKADMPDYHTDALAWFRGCISRAPGQGAPFHRMAERLHHLQEVVLQDPEAGSKMHRQMVRFVATELAPELGALFEILHNEIEEQSRLRARYTEDLRAEAEGAINNIETVTKMVRLISLNASVEAARAGEQGRAFGVIAQEVKKLSESIGQSTGHVTSTVGRLANRL